MGRHGAPYLWKRAASVSMWRHAALMAYCRRSDVWPWSYGELEHWRLPASVATWRRRLEDLGVRRKRADLETWGYGALEASGRCEGMEAWSSGALARCRRVDVEVRSEGALEMRCW